MSTSQPADPQTGVSNPVYSVHLTTEINAPFATVWEVLTDLPKYHEWNPFVRSMTVVDESDPNGQVPQVLEVGKGLVMICNIPPSLSDRKDARTVNELIKVVDPVNGTLSWQNIDYPNWAMQAQRWQTLTRTSDGTTSYDTHEDFNGVLAYFLKWFLGKSLVESFQGFVTGLKSRSESLAAGTGTGTGAGN